MKTKKYITFLCAGLFLAGCEKEIAIKSLEFDVVSTAHNGKPATEFALGDTVSFKFTGNPDFISFYSGKLGSRYEFKDRTEAAGTPLLSFTSSLTQKNINLPNSLSLLVSNDFKGIVNVPKWDKNPTDTLATAANLSNATWVNISAKASLSPGTNASYVSSGLIDLAAFADQNKPVYIAFKYVAPAGVAQPKWSIRDFLLINKLNDGTEYIVANMQLPTAPFTNYGVTTFSPGWATFRDDSVSPSVAWTLTSAAPLSLDISGASATDANAKNAETWAVIGPINLKKVSADNGVAVKNIANRVYDYFIPKADNYTIKGPYKAVFEASNVNADNSNSKLKEIQLVIK